MGVKSPTVAALAPGLFRAEAAYLIAFVYIRFNKTTKRRAKSEEVLSLLLSEPTMGLRARRDREINRPHVATRKPRGKRLRLELTRFAGTPEKEGNYAPIDRFIRPGN